MNPSGVKEHDLSFLMVYLERILSSIVDQSVCFNLQVISLIWQKMACSGMEIQRKLVGQR